MSIRRTKIVATLGPATGSPEMIGRLLDRGVNVVRINMSHAAHPWVRQVTRAIREAASARRIHVGLLMDTQGPAIRTGDLPAPLDLKPGQRFTFLVRGDKSSEPYSVSVNYDHLANDLNVGDLVMIDNGVIQMKVLAKTASRVECEVLTPGLLGNRRHINLPGVKVSLPALTEKDLADVELGLELRFDFIAMSFVREAADIRQLRAVIKSSEAAPLIVAKIEDQQAVKNIEEIIREADGVMVARGDLGIECPYEELPIIQRRVVKLCLQLGRPVIVATHMLESMIESPIPTRAEITDVANAVFEQSDAIMLSGETTVGKYPVQCVEVFDRIARRIERSGGANYHERAELSKAREKLAKSGVGLANDLKADAILVFTLHGNTARYASWMRPRNSPLYAFCQDDAVARSLTLWWGIVPFVLRFDPSDPSKTLAAAMQLLVERNFLNPGNTVVVIGSVASGEEIVDALQMRVVG